MVEGLTRLSGDFSGLGAGVFVHTRASTAGFVDTDTRHSSDDADAAVNVGIAVAAAASRTGWQSGNDPGPEIPRGNAQHDI